MGKRPPHRPQFWWARRQSGHYWAHVDGIDYSADRLSSHRWELTATTGTPPARVASTIAESYRHLRCWARVNHDHIRRRATAAAHPEESTMTMTPVVIVRDTLLTLAANNGTLTLTYTSEGEGWYAHLVVHPHGGEKLEFSTLTGDPAAAVLAVCIELRTEFGYRVDLPAPARP